MEEDGGVKAPVTRLRRRLSVELSEESKSPGPTTPTKKRGGRLAAKPQLELIDENTPQNSPKKTTRRRSTARDLAEVEEKPLTPSRRSTRIKSNTSILSETPQAVDSPRAKRALRRNSQAGSDTETPTPVTPARTRRARKDSITSLDKQVTSTSGSPVTPARIRRTRKDSASSIDKPAENEEASRTALIKEVIAEEPENNLIKSVTDDKSPSEKKINGSPSSPRKSARLSAKKNRNSKSENEQNESFIQEPDVNMNISADKSKLNGSISKAGDIKIILESKQENIVDRNSQVRLSLSSTNILSTLEEPTKKSNMNKSTSSLLQIPSDIKNKRHRTKSWTTLPSSSPKDGIFYSDNESTKKKNKNEAKVFIKRLTMKEIKKTNLSPKVQGENDTEKKINSSVSNKKKRHSQNSESDKSMKELILDQAININSLTVQSPKPSKDNPEGNKENLSGQTSATLVEHLFRKAPSIQSVLFIEDSDTDNSGKINKNDEIENEDQRVPEVEQVKKDDSPKESETNILNIPTEKQIFSSLPTNTDNDTCEPMDIDETMPENILNDHSGEDYSVHESKSKSEQKSLVIDPHDNANKSINNSNIKSYLYNSVSQDHEATNNENKSTLILSQIKDLSTGFQDTSKTSNDSRKVNELASESVKEPETNKKNKNISTSCLTSTPVLQKDEKLPLQMNTSAITPHNESKKVKIGKKKKISMMSKSPEADTSDEDSDDISERNNLVIDEAEDAGDDYESGDSQDEEERQYERNHEIVDKGITLTSDDEVTNDSDYEKDSFVVSSDEEDNELLSGSGEDLEMSDNELTMSAKSKKKYNDRLSKQQKKASREMFQARHRLDKTEQTTGSKVAINNRQRLDSSLLESDDTAVVPPKKKKRMRLESTLESTSAKSDAEEPKPAETVEEEIGDKKKKSKHLSQSVSQPGNEMKVSICENVNSIQDKSGSEEILYKKKKSKRLSESVCNESVINEKEITAICDTTTSDDPLQLQIKQEPKSPRMDLNISTVHFSVTEEIEQVQVNNDVSIMTGNETSDPLQSFVVQDKNDEGSDEENSSISENEEITKNYDSVLNQLNEDIKPKIKSVDISLDFNNKKKQKPKHPVIEQLNITQTKKCKSKKKVETTESKSVFKKTAIPHDDYASSSDSVDLKLLFSDDSNDSEKGSSAVQNKSETEEKVISLKRTEGRTNLSINSSAIHDQSNENISLNNTSKKKNKRKSTITDAQILPFFIDTIGNQDESFSKSASTVNQKNKDNSASSCEFEIEGKSKAIDSSDDAPAEVSNASLKKKNKSKKVSLSIQEDATNETEANDNLTDNLVKIPGIENKKKKADHHRKSDKELSIIGAHDKSLTDQKGDLDTSSEMSNKKGKSKIIDSGDNAPTEVSSAGLKKKNKLKKISLSVQEDATNETEANYNLTDHVKIPGTENKKKATQHRNSDKELSITGAHDKSVAGQKGDVETSSEISNKKENKKRKRVSSAKDEADYLVPKESDNIPTINIPIKMNESLVSNSRKKRKLVEKKDIAPADPIVSGNKDNTISDQKIKTLEHKENASGEKSRKRKEREDDVHDKKLKVLKQNSSEKKQVPRLPSTILEQLEDKPKKLFIETKAPKVVSTTEFKVEKARIRRNKPSEFLEESIYLNTDSESPEVKKQKLKVKKPVVLPFTPTVSISDSGFTTKFHVTPIPQKIEFVAQKIDATNFKTDYLNARRSKKLRTHELYKNNWKIKLSKY